MTIASPPSPLSGPGTASVPAPASPLTSWTRKHLLGLEDLSADEIMAILETAESFAEISTAQPQEGSRAIQSNNLLAAHKYLIDGASLRRTQLRMPVFGPNSQLR